MNTVLIYISLKKRKLLEQVFGVIMGCTLVSADYISETLRLEVIHRPYYLSST